MTAQQKWIVRFAAIVAGVAACSTDATKTSDDKTTVQGTVGQALYATDVEAVAVGADGRSFWSKLDTHGDFKLSVSAGQSYRILLARRDAEGMTSAVARLALTNAAGKTSWISARAGTTLRLGQLVPAGTLVKNPATKTDPSAVGTASRGSGRGGYEEESAESSGSGRSGSGRGGEGSGDDDSHDDYEDDAEHSDDPECHEGGTDASKSLCSEPSSGEMECSRNGAEEVSESGDYGRGEAAVCEPQSPAPAPSDGTVSTPPSGSAAGSSGSAPPSDSPIVK
jgi:hypothetical protein